MSNTIKKVSLYLFLVVCLISFTYIIATSVKGDFAGTGNGMTSGNNFENETGYYDTLLGGDYSQQFSTNTLSGENSNDTLQVNTNGVIGEQASTSTPIAQKDSGELSGVENNCEVMNIKVFFYQSETVASERFTQDEIDDFINKTSNFNYNDDLYSVVEYFYDVSYNSLKLNFTYDYRNFDEYRTDSEFLRDKEYDITINCYPVHPEPYTKYWASCSGKCVCLPKNVMVSTICHELIHTFGVSDLYRRHSGDILDASARREAFVDGWDIMSFSNNKEPQYPTVYSLNYINLFSESYFFDLEKTNIELVGSSCHANIKATSYATKEDTIAIKITANALGYDSLEYFIIEYRKPNGRKDYFTPTKKDAVIVYRVNPIVYNNAHAEDDSKSLLYIFRKYNQESIMACALTEGDTFGSYTDRFYNTIYFTNGDNTGIVISNIKFNSDNSCSFDVGINNQESVIEVSGKLSNGNIPVANSKIVVGNRCLGMTNKNGEFYVRLYQKCTLQFIVGSEIVYEYDVVGSEKCVLFNLQENKCRIEIVADTSNYTVFINDKTQYNCYNKTLEIVLNSGDKIKVVCAGYKDYEITYSGQSVVKAELEKCCDDKNIFEQMADNIATNGQAIVDTISSLWSGFVNSFNI